MKKFYEVKINELSKYTDKITFVGADLKDQSTNSIYFKKVTLADLTDEEAEDIFAIRDLIAKKQTEYFFSLPMEQIQKFDNINKEKKENTTVIQKQEELTSAQILENGKNFLTIGLTTKEIIKYLKPIYGKFVFLDKDCDISLKNNTDSLIKILDLDYVNVYLFLLAISI